MNFSLVPFAPQIGQISKKIVPPNLVLPIIQGPLRGIKWFVASGNLEYFLGSFEEEKVALFVNSIQKEWIVYDIGANVGFYTLLTSKYVGKKGKVIAFEPNPIALRYLKKNVAINNFSNIKIIGTAVTNESGKHRFDDSLDISCGRLDTKGNIEVVTLTIDEFATKTEAPNCMKIDVEGGEYKVLQGAKKSLTNYRPLLFIATHGIEQYNKCVDFLKKLKYEIRIISKNETGDRQELICWAQ